MTSPLSGFSGFEPKFQHVFAQDTLATGVTNILLQCPLYGVQRPGGYFLSLYISEYGDVWVYVSALLLYDTVCFSTSNEKLYEKSLF